LRGVRQETEAQRVGTALSDAVRELLLLILLGLSTCSLATTCTCNSDLLFDSTLVFINDLRANLSEVVTPMKPDVMEPLLPYCARFFRQQFGLETEAYWLKNGTLPDGLAGFAATMEFLRIYGLATPEYPDNFPMTNGKVLDDTFVILNSIPIRFNGTFAEMMAEEGMPNLVQAVSFITCGQYRVFKNSTQDGKEVKEEIAPPIRYVGLMPMPVMFADTTNSFFSSDIILDCELESALWGKGIAKGFATVRTKNGTTTFRAREVLTFPATIEDRTWPPKFGRCEPL